MNEVSCRVFEVFERSLKAKGLSMADMVAGTTVSAAKVASRRERIDWAEFVAVMRNIRPHFTDEEYVAVGRTAMSTPGLKFALVIARLALAPMDIYRWMNTPRQGLGNQLFACIVPSCRQISPNQIVVELVLPEDFELCWDFFVISACRSTADHAGSRATASGA